jgi:hypothetical protein
VCAEADGLDECWFAFQAGEECEGAGALVGAFLVGVWHDAECGCESDDRCEVVVRGDRCDFGVDADAFGLFA